MIPEKEAPAEINVNANSNLSEAELFEKDLVGIYAGLIGKVVDVTKDVADDAKDVSMDDAPPKDD